MCVYIYIYIHLYIYIYVCMRIKSYFEPFLASFLFGR